MMIVIDRTLIVYYVENGFHSPSCMKKMFLHKMI